MHQSKCIVFMPTNGIGLGHLTRCLAIARRLKKTNPKLSIVFFTTSNAIHLVYKEGFIGYFIPSEFISPLDKKKWNKFLEVNLHLILSSHKPDLFIFDGVQPYLPIKSLERLIPNIKKIWIRKGLNKNEIQSRELYEEYKKWFHYIFVPGEKGVVINKERKNEFLSEPIIFLNKDELLQKDYLQKKWNVPDSFKVVYIQLGAGTNWDNRRIVEDVITLLKEINQVFIVLGESIIGERQEMPGDHFMILKDYPNSAYFQAFDLAISAAGYNTFHELMYFNVPSIFIPNPYLIDNQLARAKHAQTLGAAFVVDPPTKENIQECIYSALKPDALEKMKKATTLVLETNGADQLATYILEIMKGM